MVARYANLDKFKHLSAYLSQSDPAACSGNCHSKTAVSCNGTNGNLGSTIPASTTDMLQGVCTLQTDNV